jgi:hypothetical protein
MRINKLVMKKRKFLLEVIIADTDADALNPLQKCRFVQELDKGVSWGNAINSARMYRPHSDSVNSSSNY